MSNKAFPPSDVDHDLNKLVFKLLKFSYDELKDEITKCFFSIVSCTKKIIKLTKPS